MWTDAVRQVVWMLSVTRLQWIFPAVCSMKWWQWPWCGRGCSHGEVCVWNCETTLYNAWSFYLHGNSIKCTINECLLVNLFKYGRTWWLCATIFTCGQADTDWLCVMKVWLFCYKHPSILHKFRAVAASHIVISHTRVHAYTSTHHARMHSFTHTYTHTHTRTKAFQGYHVSQDKAISTLCHQDSNL